MIYLNLFYKDTIFDNTCLVTFNSRRMLISVSKKLVKYSKQISFYDKRVYLIKSNILYFHNKSFIYKNFNHCSEGTS